MPSNRAMCNNGPFNRSVEMYPVHSLLNVPKPIPSNILVRISLHLISTCNIDLVYQFTTVREQWYIISGGEFNTKKENIEKCYA